LVLNPAIIALLSGAFLVSGFAVYASLMGIQILRWWDIQSGSERQLMMERKTYLITTIFTYLLGLELFSLFLFVYTADHIHGLFVGAMCAAGSLNVNDFGYPTLVLKVIAFILCGIWLILNHTDNQGEDYPLIRTKYKLLLVVSGVLVLGTILQTKYFLGLRADVITSCCGALFSEDAETIAGGLAGIPPSPIKFLFLLSAVLTFRSGIHVMVTARGAILFAALAAWTMIVSLGFIISFVSPYYYELPTHHCPFCLLQKEYGYIGYPLYFSLFLAGITGAGVGVIDRFKGIPSLRETIRRSQRTLCLVSMIGYGAFVLISVYPVIFSDFVLEGH
jgi:hypothetical protein